MSSPEKRNDWTVVAAVTLIVLGVWFLLGNVLGHEWVRLVRRVMSVAWPLALIGLGVLLYMASQRGGLSNINIRGGRLYRSRSDRMVGGVLGGLGELLGIDPTWLRVGYALIGLVLGVWPAVVLYVVAMIIVPEAPAGTRVEPPTWPQTGQPTVTPTRPSTGWPHTGGTETVQTPPAPPEQPRPTVPGPPDAEPPGEHGPAQS